MNAQLRRDEDGQFWECMCTAQFDDPAAARRCCEHLVMPELGADFEANCRRTKPLTVQQVDEKTVPQDIMAARRRPYKRGMRI